MNPSKSFSVAVVGGGPSGLMAAEVLSAAGVTVTVYDRMPSLGRKFLMAGRGGLNLTHSEPLDRFLRRYGPATEGLRGIIEAFPPKALVNWAEGLGQPTFVGSSGRVFPKTMKASPLLREWLKRLEAQGVRFRLRRTWTGWSDTGELVFNSPDGPEGVRADAVILALGGGSWAKLGSDGQWTTTLQSAGARITPFRPSNVGFLVNWSEVFRDRFAGTPLKAVGLSFAGRQVKGEVMLSAYGLEGGGIYALSSPLRDAVDGRGAAVVEIDLRPELSAGQIENKLAR
ncbi:MAG: TIGR03862 family flavoprotein, partial [Phenylobacterium sp.]